MVTSVIKHERIMTTHPKAKAAQRMTDKMITLAKNDNLQSRREAHAYIREKDMVHKLFTVLADRYKYRPAGFTRVMHVKNRTGDSAPMSYLELVDREGEIQPAKLCTKEYDEARKAQVEEHTSWQKRTRF